MGDVAEDSEGQSRQVRFQAWAGRWWWVLIPIAAVATVKWWIKDPTLTLAYLKALVWPVLAGVVLYWLREPLKAKIAQLRKGEFAGASAEFDLNQNLGRDVEQAANVLRVVTTEDFAQATEDAKVEVVEESDQVSAEAQSDTNPDPPEETEETSPSPGPTHSKEAIERRIARHNSEIVRRRAIEKIIEESAEWGYGMAKIGFQTTPLPVIEWTDDGRPIIKYAKGQRMNAANLSGSGTLSATGYVPEVKARNLEREIRDLELDLATEPVLGAMSLGKAERDAGKRKRLADLKNKLRQVDPNSAYSD